LQDFRIIQITNYFPTVNPVHRVNARWTGAGWVVHRGPTVAWTEGTAACSPELGLRPLRCTKTHRRGRKMEREVRETRLGSHRSSGGAVEAGRRWCRTGRRRRSVRCSCGLRSERLRARWGVVMAGGAPRPFIGAGGAPGRDGRELIAGVNVFNAIERVKARFEGD
jgi:hypothetical protein